MLVYITKWLSIWLDDGKECLLAEPGLVRALVDMVAMATPYAKTTAARCLGNIAMLGLFLFICTILWLSI